MATAPNSGSAGYLMPAAGPPYDADLEDIFQQMVVGITGLPGNRVIPRWQPEPPNIPPFGSDWAAVGVTVDDRNWNAYQWWDTPSQSYIVEGTEAINVLFTFYGPNNQKLRRMLEDGIMLDQNRDAIYAQGIKFIEFKPPVALPALLKQRWQKRVDIKGIFSRLSRKTYPVQTIVGTSQNPLSGINNEKFVTPIVVNPPTP
jgi:hypothetical protein